MASKTDKYAIQFDIKGVSKLQKYQQGLQRTNNQLDKLKKKIKGQTTATAAQADKLTRLTAQQKVYTSHVKKGITALTQNTAAKKKNTAAAGATGKAMAAMGLSVAGAVMALRRLGTFLISNVKEFAKFEQGVKNVTTLMSADDTGLFRGDLFKGSLQLSRDFGFALDDVNKAMFNAVSAGVNGGDAIKFLNEASTLAVAGVTNLKSATLGLTTVLNAYGMEASETARVSQILFTTQKFGVTTVEELSKSLGVVVPFAAASGISLEELGASIAVTTRSGLDAAKTVTALRAAISQMQKPAAESRDLFLEYGIPIGAAEMKTVGFTETLSRLNKVYKESPEIIEQMFGNVRGLTAIFSLAGDNADQYQQILKELNDETITAANLQKALDENMDSAQMGLDKLSTAYTGLKVAMGDSDFVDNAATAMANFFNVLSSDEVSTMDKIESFFLKFAGQYAGIGNDVILLAEAQSEASKKSAKNFVEGLKSSEDGVKTMERIRERMIKGDGFTPEDIKFMKMVASKEDLAPFNATLANMIKSYKASLDKIKKEDDEAAAKQEELDNAKTISKRKYNEREFQGRKALAKKIEEITMEGVENDQYQNVTNLAIAKAKYAELEALENHHKEHGGASARELTRIAEQMSKLRVDIRKKEISILESNTKDYNDTQTDMATDLAKNLQDIALEEVQKNELTNRQLNIYKLEEQEQYYIDLLKLDGQSADEREKNERALAAIRIKLAKEVTAGELEQNKLKEKYAKMSLDVIADAVKANAETQLANKENSLEKEQAAAQEQADLGLINQRELKTKERAIEEEKFNLRKEHEKKMLRISLAQELANHAIGAALNPLAGITFGGASISQYAIMSGLAMARYASNLAAIEKQEFARGGLVYGKSHAQGGEMFAVGGRVAELEGGEAVINKRSTAMFGGALSAMNQAGGGVSFSSPNINNSGLIDYSLLGKVIGGNTNVVLPVESLNKTQNKVKVKQESVRF